MPVIVFSLLVVAPFLISQCYNKSIYRPPFPAVVAPFLISQCYNVCFSNGKHIFVVAPFLISQCYNFASLQS